MRESSHAWRITSGIRKTKRESFAAFGTNPSSECKKKNNISTKIHLIIDTEVGREECDCKFEKTIWFP
jgi:hypothetical protein